MTSPDQPRSGPRATPYRSIVMWRRTVFLGTMPAIAAIGAAIWMGRDTLARLGPGDLAVLGVIILAFVVIGLGIFVLAVAVPTVSRPAEQLADVAEAAASGDLSRVTGAIGKGGIHRLSTAVNRMLGELRTVVRALRDSSSETAALAAEITTGAEHMASAAQEMAATSNELSRQSTEMADTIQAMARDAQRLVTISEELSGGAHEGVQRNSRLRVLAAENRQRLDESAGALETLAAEVEGSAAAVEALADASEEIRAFVTFVQKMARQSKLLALNAAMEAARAGEQGQGFAVVASEVRRLAAGASEAAERTEALVQGVLAGVADSRASSGRAVEVVTAVTAATRQAQQSFALVEEGVNEVEAWTATIDRAATSSRALVIDTTRGLDELAKGTEAFAAAMEQVAASSQEQSASTEEIAAAASALNAASGRLAQIVTTFRLGENEPQQPATPTPPVTFRARTSGAIPGTLRLA